MSSTLIMFASVNTYLVAICIAMHIVALRAEWARFIAKVVHATGNTAPDLKHVVLCEL